MLENPALVAAVERRMIAPIVLDVAVPCPPQRAFEYFTRDIGRWWPLAKHSCAQADAVTVAFEPRVGGRLLETARDGTEHPWGTVLEWDPPRRLRFSWHPGGDPAKAQWVEITFAANAKGTRVTLTHGGWEALGERAEATRTQYENGWPTVFGKLYADYATSGSPT